MKNTIAQRCAELARTTQMRTSIAKATRDLSRGWLKLRARRKYKVMVREQFLATVVQISVTTAACMPIVARASTTATVPLFQAYNFPSPLIVSRTSFNASTANPTYTAVSQC